MKPWQFTVSVQMDDGFNVEIAGLLTPIVYANGFYDALKHPDIINFCQENKCTVYKVVGK